MITNQWQIAEEFQKKLLENLGTTNNMEVLNISAIEIEVSEIHLPIGSGPRASFSIYLRAGIHGRIASIVSVADVGVGETLTIDGINKPVIEIPVGHKLVKK